MYDKIYITPYYVERVREYALSIGKTEEWFDKWVEDCVIIIEPIEGY